MKRSLDLLGRALVFAGLVSTGYAQNGYDLSWYSVDAGGGISSGGIFDMAGVVGQHDASDLASKGTFSAGGGFLYDTSIYLPVVSADTDGLNTLGLKGWWRADDGITTDSTGKVLGWLDTSGQNHHAMQTTAGKRPTYQAAGINGRPAIDFDGTDDALQAADATLPTGNSSYSIFCMVKPDVLANRGFLGSGVSVVNQRNNLRISSTGQVNNVWFSNDVITPPGGVSAGTPVIITATYDSLGAGRRLSINGTVLATGSSLAHNGQGAFNLIGDTGVGTEWWDGQIGEIILFDRTLLTSRRSALENYLALKYSTGVSTVATPAFPAAQTGTFPLGSHGIAINLTANSSGAGSLSGQRFNSDPGGVTNGGSALSNDGTVVTPDRVSRDRYWQVTATGLSVFTYTVSVDVSGIPGIANPDKLVIVKRDSAALPWQPLNTARIGNYLSTAGLTSFSEFSIAGDAASGTLPVGLSEFITE